MTSQIEAKEAVRTRTKAAAKAAKKTKKPAKPAKAKAPRAPKKAVNSGKTKRQIMLDMVCSKNGATEAEICKTIGWKACLVTLRRAAAAEGVTLRTEKQEGGRARYIGARS